MTGDTEGEPLESMLKGSDPTFRAIPGLSQMAPPSSFKNAAGFAVDLLTPQLRRDDANPMPLAKLQAGAVPVQYLRWLMDGAVPGAVLHGSGIAVTVPAPARFAMHKLIVAQERTFDRGKRQKDLLQAKALIEALGLTDRWAVADAYEDAVKRGETG